MPTRDSAVTLNYWDLQMLITSIFKLILTLQHFKLSRHLVVEGLWMLNKTNAACLLWLLYTDSQFPQVPILISDPFFFPADSHLFLSLACFPASKDRKPLRHKFFQMNISSMFAPGFLLKDRKCWWEECEECRVLAGTCKFCFCPEYYKKNTQILKDRHFLCIGAVSEFS